MLSLVGEGVTIWRPATTYDARMDPVTAWQPEHVDNVLFGRPSTEQVDETMRAYGVHVQYVLGIPKAYGKSLRGCRVTRDRDVISGASATTTTTTTTGPEMVPPVYVVAGDPAPLPPELCPTDWNREAMVGWVDG